MHQVKFKKMAVPTLFLWCLFGLSSLSFAQFGVEDMSPVTRTHAITNATVVTAPGKVLQNATVVMRNGLVVQVGTNVTIPGDAEIIEADSMYIYPGFISGLGHAGVQRPDSNQERERPDNPGYPPNNLAGITPEVQVADLLDTEDNNLEKMRQAGFTAAHVVPEGRMLPGSGAIVLFKGEKPEDMLVRDNVSMFAQLSGAPRMFPSTVMGVTAKYRQLYRQAALGKQHEQVYASNPGGVNRPDYGKEIKAFYPVIDKSKKVYFKAPELLDAHRVLQLQKELGFSLVLSDLKQGWDLINALKNSGHGVYLSLDLPELPEEETEDTAAVDSASAATALADSAVQQEAPTMAELEMQELKKRKKEAAEMYHKQAKMFAEAGIRFGFSTLEAKPGDLVANLRSVVKMGLPEDAALAALTTTPAEMLGVSRIMGTVEPGKMANLFISSKPFFDEGASVRYVFVEGEMFEYEDKAGKKSDPDAVVAIAGTWDYSVESPQGTTTGVITITGADGDYEGNITSSMNSEAIELQDITVTGNQITFSYSVSMGAQNADITTTLVVEDDTFEGDMTVGQWGSFPVEGQRRNEPNKRR